MSDGELWALGIVTSDCAGLFASEAVVLNQLVTLKEYLINAASGQKVCVIMQMAPVAVEEGAELTKIGGARANHTRTHGPPTPRLELATSRVVCSSLLFSRALAVCTYMRRCRANQVGLGGGRRACAGDRGAEREPQGWRAAARVAQDGQRRVAHQPV